MNRDESADTEHPGPQAAHGEHAATQPDPHGPRAKRPPSTWVRVWAWALGTLAFLTPWALLGLSPKPAAQATDPAPPQPPQQPAPVVHRVVKRVIIHQAPPRRTRPTVSYVGEGSSSSGGGSWSGSSGTSGGAGGGGTGGSGGGGSSSTGGAGTTGGS